MMTMPGCVYGVGVGPGEPELMTLKAVRILNEVDVIAFPGRDPDESTAYKIAASVVPAISDKEHVSISVPMIYDREEIRQEQTQSIQRIRKILDEGKDIAYLTMGDPTIYSSFCYYQKELEAEGYRTESVSGVPSFCAVAATLKIPLVEWQEQMHIIPAAHQQSLQEHFSGTSVFMKTGSRLQELKESLARSGMSMYMVEDCGMENEKAYRDIEEIPDHCKYYATVIARMNKEG